MQQRNNTALISEAADGAAFPSPTLCAAPVAGAFIQTPKGVSIMYKSLLVTLFISALPLSSVHAGDVPHTVLAVVNQEPSDLPSSVQALGFARRDTTPAACMVQLAALEKMLLGAGYGSREDALLSDDRLAIRWYHPGTDTTVIAVADLHPSGSSIEVSSLPYHDH